MQLAKVLRSACSLQEISRMARPTADQRTPLTCKPHAILLHHCRRSAGLSALVYAGHSARLARCNVRLTTVLRGRQEMTGRRVWSISTAQHLQLQQQPPSRYAGGTNKPCTQATSCKQEAAWSAPDGAGCSRHAVDALGGECGAAHCDRVVSEAANWIGLDGTKCQLGSAPSAVCPQLWLI